MSAENIICPLFVDVYLPTCLYNLIVPTRTSVFRWFFKLLRVTFQPRVDETLGWRTLADPADPGEVGHEPRLGTSPTRAGGQDDGS